MALADAELSRADELLRRVAELAAETGQRADNDRRTGKELVRLKAEFEQMRRPWWRRLVN